MLDAYEYIKSSENAANKKNKGYLHIGLKWWLINPKDSSNVYAIDYSTGSLYTYSPNNINYRSGVRPCIYLNSDVTISGGLGTRNNPYKIGEDLAKPINGITKINTRASGEYLTFKGDSYRIVQVQDNTTKIVKSDVLMVNDEILTKDLTSYKYDGDELYGTSDHDNYWDYYLNNTWLTNNDKTLLEQGIYYLGNYQSESYKSTICKNPNTIESTNLCEKVDSIYVGYVGLLRVGEMFSSQSKKASPAYWLITPSGGNVNERLIVDFASFLTKKSSGYSQKYAARPTVNLKSNVVIASDNTGDGTEQNPFKIELGS